MQKLRIAMMVIGLLLIGVAYISSEIINQNPNYNQIISSKEAEDVELSYISATEYVLPRDHLGSTIVSLRDKQRNFINTTCYATILYPDRSVYLPSTLMLQDVTYGIYYLHWQVPEFLGVFDQEVGCEVNSRNITQGKAFHVSNMTNILLQANNNLNQSINLVLSALNCSNPNYFQTCAYLQSINGSMSQLSNNSFISSNDNNTEVLISINSTLNDFTKIYYKISANNCYVGSTWNFKANVTNEEAESLPFLVCSLNSSRFGYETIPYVKSLDAYSVTHNCTSPSGIVNWNLNCQRV